MYDTDRGVDWFVDIVVADAQEVTADDIE